MSDRCGFPGCDLPAGHNRGRADVPANHRVVVSEGNVEAALTVVRRRAALARAEAHKARRVEEGQWQPGTDPLDTVTEDVLLICAALRSRGSTDCDGSDSCQASIHMHGCFSDKGDCDHPSEHERGSTDTRLTEALRELAAFKDGLTFERAISAKVCGEMSVQRDEALEVLTRTQAALEGLAEGAAEELERIAALAAARADAPQETS